MLYLVFFFAIFWQHSNISRCWRFPNFFPDWQSQEIEKEEEQEREEKKEKETIEFWRRQRRRRPRQGLIRTLILIFVLRSMWPYLAKARHFGQNLNSFASLGKFYLVFGKLLKLPWQLFMLLGNFYYCKWPKKKRSSHLVTLFPILTTF